ncbi:MerR family transcriptional regulator [Nonomuraea endophytica]|uniref:MerR family transcriptional regulator n=1 Tax=Nonomuraea endophytica TaxID=714136 RepID=UPI0037CCBB4B
MRETWTIGELAERAADALRPGLQRANGRIREVPGERLIRWYTTIGLVDPPLTRRGRLAQYGRRHLLQVVAVKRLQAEGHSIAEIQTRLTGATDATLEATALLEPPSSFQGSDQGSDLPDGTRDEGPRPRFWASHPTTEPTPPSPRSAAGTSTGAGQREAADAASRLDPEAASRPAGPAGPRVAADGAPQAAQASARGDATRETARDAIRDSGRGDTQESGREAARGSGREAPRGGGRVSGVWLAAGVALVLDGAGRTPTDDDIEAVLAAAGPLLQVLQERKLT